MRHHNHDDIIRGTTEQRHEGASVADPLRDSTSTEGQSQETRSDSTLGDTKSRAYNRFVQTTSTWGETYLSKGSIIIASMPPPVMKINLQHSRKVPDSMS
jgi:hypothetical protein